MLGDAMETGQLGEAPSKDFGGGSEQSVIIRGLRINAIHTIPGTSSHAVTVDINLAPWRVRGATGDT
jgi:hypothetical protein